MEKIQQASNGGNAFAEGDASFAAGGDGGDSKIGPGGNGGNARALGKNSFAMGGRGGRGGIGPGMPGMDVEVIQDNAGGIGGDGGESSQPDGRGGRGGPAPDLGVFGLEHARRARMKLPYDAPNIYPGRGGDAPDTPQYKARRLIIEQIKERHYQLNKIPHAGYDIWYDREVVPIQSINIQLAKDGHKWAVLIEDNEYTFDDNLSSAGPSRDRHSQLSRKLSCAATFFKNLRLKFMARGKG